MCQLTSNRESVIVIYRGYPAEVFTGDTTHSFFDASGRAFLTPRSHPWFSIAPGKGVKLEKFAHNFGQVT